MKLLKICISLLILVNISFSSTAQQNNQIKKVLISQVIDHPALNATTQGIIAGLEQAGYKGGVNLDVRVESAQGNPTMAAQIANKFVTQNPDLVVGVGTVSAQSFIKYANSKRVKLVFSSVTDPVAANLAVSATKGNNNISGVSNFVSIGPQLQLFKQLQPNLKNLGFIYNPGEINSVTIARKLEDICYKYNIELHKQTVAKSADVAQAVVKLAGAVDAILISNDNTALSSLQSIIKAAQQRNIPVYVSDTDAVELGALAAFGPNQFELGKQTGRMIAKVLQGVDIQTLPVEYPDQTDLFLNLEAAQKAQIKVEPTILSQAKSVIKVGKL